MTTPEQDLPYWVAFSRIRPVGRVRVTLMEERFGSLKAAWEASGSELSASGLPKNVVGAIEEARRSIDPEREMDAVRRANVAVFTWHDAGYPRVFHNTDDPPPSSTSRERWSRTTSRA